MAKNILMVAYTSYLNDARTRREAETLVKRGDNVYFIATAEKSRPQSEIVAGVKVHRVPFERYQGGSGVKYILHYLKFFFAASILVLKFYRKQPIDVVYVHTMPDFMVFVGLAPKLLGAKIVLNVHDMMPELYMSKFGIGETSLIIRLIKLQEKLSCKFADHIICVHHPHRDVLVKRGISADKIIILMNVPDPRIFNAECDVKTGGDGFRMIYHGTVARRLGLDIAVDAFAAIHAEYPTAIFEIYGDGDAAEALETQISRLRLEEHVKFHRKFFRVDDIPTIVSGAHLGIIPNRKDLATEYMLPVKLMEYAHLGVPAAAPRLLTIRYYFPEDCLAYYEAGDSSDLARVIRKSINDRQRGECNAAAAKKILEKYRWDAMKSALFDIIDK